MGVYYLGMKILNDQSRYLKREVKKKVVKKDPCQQCHCIGSYFLVKLFRTFPKCASVFSGAFNKIHLQCHQMVSSFSKYYFWHFCLISTPLKHDSSGCTEEKSNFARVMELTFVHYLYYLA